MLNDELKRLAALAKLRLNEKDADSFAEDISEMLDFANAVVSADTDGDACDAPTYVPLRHDEVIRSYSNSEVLSNCGETRDGYFVARKKEKEEPHDVNS